MPSVVRQHHDALHSPLATRHSPVSSPKKVFERCNAAGDTSWIKDELAACEFADIRLARRLSLLLERLSNGIGNTLPLVCQDWANTKAAYRFFSNARVSEAAIFAGRFESTSKRFAAQSCRLRPGAKPSKRCTGLGGYLARTHDPPPGNTVMWRGLTRLTDIELGYLIREEGNG
jgi:hypothetical protein